MQIQLTPWEVMVSEVKRDLNRLAEQVAQFEADVEALKAARVCDCPLPTRLDS